MRWFVEKCLLRLSATQVFLLGLVFAVAAAEAIAAGTSTAMTGTVTPAMWVGAFVAPLIVAGAELALLIAVINRLREQIQRDHETEALLIQDGLTRRRTEEGLRSSEEKLRALFDLAPVGIVLNGMDGRFVEANRSLLTMLGYSLEQLNTLSYWDLTPQHYAEDEARQLESLRTTGRYGPYDKEYIDCQGRCVPIRLNGMLITGSDGEKYIWSIIEDITEELAAERALLAKTQELANSNAELEQFAYIASHDLREPLRMVSSYIGLLGRRYGDLLDTDGREFMAFAIDGATRMDRLILDLLEYSRVGRKVRPMAQLPLRTVVEEALSILKASIDQTAAHITLAEGLPEVFAERNELVRLFQNLIGNALKYRTPDRAPEIAVSARRQDGAWVVTVADNGIGIDPAQFERIFRIFQRLHGPGQFEGTGIGLAICKKIAEHHGGKIWVESVPGEGSRFSVSLPDEAARD